MEKICHDWKHLLDKDFTNGKYWNDFAENAQNASVEIKIVKSYKDAIADIFTLENFFNIHFSLFNNPS